MPHTCTSFNFDGRYAFQPAKAHFPLIMTSDDIRQSFLDFFREKQHSIVPSGSLLPEAPNLLFTNAGMNQFVPYFLGTEKPPYDPPRAADTQKCIRAGGKHNDLDDVGYDTYHHTFFEMLGNWSFGDYFKQEAIDWAWELLVERWKFPANRLYATVYRPGVNDPSEFDKEAYNIWKKKFEYAGLDPKIHIVYGGPKDNFWMMGETGPCGPCSEIHMDLTRDGGSAGRLVNKDDPRCIEIWNLVFIQYNAEPDGTYRPLPARHVDTGMGFERVCSVIQGTDGFQNFDRLPSNYNTDVFTPIFQKITEISGKKYLATMPDTGASAKEREQQKIDVAFRVLADHIRTLSFSIADGIRPSNTDRGYVLRRILRRGLRYARDLEIELPWKGGKSLLAELSKVVLESFGDAFPELRKNEKRIAEILGDEEKSFAETLERGVELFEDHLERLRKKNASVFPADVAFKLYDTYGFPVDLTEVMARENGLTVDTDAVEQLLEEQRERSRGARQTEVVLAEGEQAEYPATVFRGFDTLTMETRLLDIVERDKEFYAIVEQTPFYAEMGGQLGDSGRILVDDEEAPVVDTLKHRDVFLHKLAAAPPKSWEPPMTVRMEVDPERRRNIAAHHTATHLLHWALHEQVGDDALQRGSLVAENRLRFDFTSSSLAPEKLAAIEEQVNRAILDNQPVSWTEQPYDEVTKREDIKALFGEKYGDTVRVVQIGGEAAALNGYSMELCGGTHVTRTGDLGMFKILSEGAISSGVRRIEAVTGLPAIQHVLGQLEEERKRAEELQEKVVEANKRLEKERAAVAQKEAAHVIRELVAQPDTSGEIPRVEHDFGEGDPGLLQAAVNSVKSLKYEGAAIFLVRGKGKQHYAVYVSPKFQKTHPANELLQNEIAPRFNGKGGGNKELARGAANLG